MTCIPSVISARGHNSGIIFEHWTFKLSSKIRNSITPCYVLLSLNKLWRFVCCMQLWISTKMDIIEQSSQISCSNQSSDFFWCNLYILPNNAELSHDLPMKQKSSSPNHFLQAQVWEFKWLPSRRVKSKHWPCWNWPPHRVLLCNFVASGALFWIMLQHKALGVGLVEEHRID